jgi:hypothetical protein
MIGLEAQQKNNVHRPLGRMLSGVSGGIRKKCNAHSYGSLLTWVD